MDNKGRFALPSKFREVLKLKYKNELLVVTNYGDCLIAYPWEEWKIIEEKLLKLPWDVPEVREYLRYFLGSAEECAPDKQGRLLLSQTLREEIGLEKEVVLLGMLNHFEIWNPKDFEEKRNKVRENFNKLIKAIHPYLTSVQNLISVHKES